MSNKTQGRIKTIRRRKSKARKAKDMASATFGAFDDDDLGDLEQEFLHLPQFDDPQTDPRRAIEILMEQRQLNRFVMDGYLE